MKFIKKLCYLTGAVFFLGATQAVAADLSAKEVMKKAFNYLSTLDKYTFDAVIYDEYLLSETNQDKYRHTVIASLDRPDRLRVDIYGDAKDRSLYINNGLFTMVDNEYGYYGELKTPKKLDKALDVIIKKYGISAPLTSLFYSDMAKRLKFKNGRNFGEKEVGGVLCDYVAFKTKKQEIHVWVTKGDKPLIKAFSMIETTKKATYRTDTSITWKEHSEMAASDFVFSAPKGVTKISINPAN